MKCPRCQHENRPWANFCFECATPVSAPASPPPPKYLAEKLHLQQRPLSRAEAGHRALRRFQGSMELLSDRDLEEARKLSTIPAIRSRRD
jgi:hypothetical protein